MHRSELLDIRWENVDLDRYRRDTKRAYGATFDGGDGTVWNPVKRADGWGGRWNLTLLTH